MKEYLFVYGTLLRGFDSPVRVQFDYYAEYICDAFVYGRLFDVQNYPAAVESTDRSLRIYGELYLLRNAETILGLLDEYEGCSKNCSQPHEYRRVITNCVLSDLSTQSSWVYFYNLPVTNLSSIPDGDYRGFIRDKNQGK